MAKFAVDLRLNISNRWRMESREVFIEEVEEEQLRYMKDPEAPQLIHIHSKTSNILRVYFL